MGFKYRGKLGRSSGSGTKWRRILVFAVIIALLAFLGLNYYINRNLTKANQFLIEGDLEGATDRFLAVTHIPFSRGIGHDGLGGIALLQNDDETAKREFQITLQKRPSRFGVDPEVLINRLIEDGMYLQGKMYRDFLMDWKPSEQLEPYYLDFVLLALGARELAEARKLLSNAPPTVKVQEAFGSLQSMANRYEQEGELPVVISRRDEPIVVYNLERSSNEFAVPQLFKGWPDPDQSTVGNLLGSLQPRDRYNLIRTTIDLDLQRCAHQAMRNFKGTMVIVDTRKGEILAAYGTPGNDPFMRSFEPGSVIKLLTYAYFLQYNGDASDYAPKTYPSSVNIDGRLFYDWKPHGRVETIEQGMAVSCNLMFAQMGIDTGWSKLRGGFGKFFDGKTRPNFFTPAKYGSILAPPETDYELGRLAIGLDHISATSLGLAQMAATIANKGVMQPPYLISEFINLRGTVYRKNEPGEPRKYMKDTVADEILKTMNAAVNFPEGTARRAKVKDIDCAMKTGTAGERPFDAIIVGVLPASHPRLAFGFALLGGGKAEFNGAQVAAELQRQIKVLAPRYLGP